MLIKNNTAISIMYKVFKLDQCFKTLPYEDIRMSFINMKTFLILYTNYILVYLVIVVFISFLSNIVYVM